MKSNSPRLRAFSGSRFSLLLILSLALAGCSGSPSAPAAAAPVEETLEEITPTAEERAIASGLELWEGGQRIAITSNPAAALRVVPQPPRAFPVNKLPPGFGERFSAMGWEDATGGFGLIVMDETHLTVAVRTRLGLSQEEQAALLSTYRFQIDLAAPEIDKGGMRAWFASFAEERLMVVTSTDPDGTYTLTAALGYAEVMDRLGMNAESLERDGRILERARGPAPSG